MCLISYAVVPFDQLVQLSSIRRLFGRPKRPFSHWRQHTTLTPLCTLPLSSAPLCTLPYPPASCSRAAEHVDASTDRGQGTTRLRLRLQDEAWLGLHCTGLWQLQQQQQQQLHDVLIDTDNAHCDAHEDFVIHGAIQWAFSSMLRRYHQVVDPSQKTVREGSKKATQEVVKQFGNVLAV